jgi:hypothetical protein
VVVGGVLGGLATRFVETKRWRREDEIRWRPDQRQAHVRFAKAADAVSRAGTRFALAAGALGPGHSGREEVDAAAEHLKRTVTALQSEDVRSSFVAGPNVRAAAARVVKLADEKVRAELLEARKGGFEPELGEAADKAVEEAREAVEDFKRAARAELGIEEHA